MKGRFQNLVGLFLLSFCYLSTSECENGCSGHGRCTAYDMCMCYRNWQANDCSERVCEFAPSFVDVPKGDLDSSGAVDAPDELLVVNNEVFPFGTSEQFPNMHNSDLTIVSQSAHDYVECSNAGNCNRTSGECNCFEGFEGAACQRMKCPGSPVCSGHGTCQTLESIAIADYGSAYRLWNKNMLTGCVCDHGYYGGDCSMRECPKGVDPMYLDDVSTINVPSFFVAVMSTADTFDLTNGFAQPGVGYFRLSFYDRHGSQYLSTPIKAGASCEELVHALAAVPYVIPESKTACTLVDITRANPLDTNSSFRITYESLYQLYFQGTKHYNLDSRPAIEDFGYFNSGAQNKSTDTLLSGYLYFLQFFGNVGYFGQPAINTFQFDGSRPSLQSQSGAVVARAWTNGMQGFDFDYFGDRCEKIQVRVKVDQGEGFIWGEFFGELDLVTCLGAIDNNSTNDLVTGPRDEIRYDPGTVWQPHFVKLVRTQTDTRDGGWMTALYYDYETNFVGGKGERDPNFDAKGAWKLLNPLKSMDNDYALYDMFASHGTLIVTDKRLGVAFQFGSNQLYTYNVSYDAYNHTEEFDLSCDKYHLKAGESSAHLPCLDKNDLFTVINPYTPADNPPYMNLYTARSIRRLLPDQQIGKYENVNSEFMPGHDPSGPITSQFLITADLNLNWASKSASNSVFHIYKFVPNANHTYHYVNECGNRGLCNTFEGLCECFDGYAGQACENQDTIAS